MLFYFQINVFNVYAFLAARLQYVLLCCVTVNRFGK